MKDKDQSSRVNESAGTGNDYHVPVLLQETIDGLNIQPGGIYIDCTFGGGGHSRAILRALGKDGKLFAFDQDADAAANLPDDPRIIFVPQNFRHIGRFLKLHRITAVDGIMADLGVSSHQFDEAARGFSTRFDADLDMRMDQRQGNTAANILNQYSEKHLHKLFEQYGEVSNAKTLARTIVEQRAIVQIRTINEFKQAVHTVVKGNPSKYFAQVFQALRIEVNEEMQVLKELLQQTPSLLKPGGRIAIITFHSLEDRLVKIFLRNGSFDEPETDDLYGRKQESPFILVSKKPILPGKEEQKSNSRSRSAKLRVAEKK